MEAENQFIQNITSKEENSIFKREVLKTSICKCGNKFESNKLERCLDCFQKEQEELYRQEWNQQQLKEHLENFNRQSMVNEKLRKVNFESYSPTNDQLTKAKAICERYASAFDLDNPRNLLLIGKYGTGKSHLAISIAKEIMQKKYMSALFISTTKLLTKLRSTYNYGNIETEDQIMNRLSRVSLLVLDDVGAEQKPSNDPDEQTWATSKIFEIIDSRIGRHTIYTTNDEINVLQQRLGGRNFSRMMEDTFVVKMYGEDYRLKDFK